MLSLEIIFLVLSIIWGPDEMPYTALAFLVFASTLVIAAIGEGIMVIKPIVDSLAAGEDVFLAPSYDNTLPEEGQTSKLKDNVEV
ncbi:conserved hypothetical protein [Ricinus communis]|uniref:Uncharacterized protein n=1 Tax=Ricinus communis TaxID=3988 RepID=B9RPE9_RICCO|nr:conserved hypothetical protein [Ricinus communis]